MESNRGEKNEINTNKTIKVAEYAAFAKQHQQ